MKKISLIAFAFLFAIGGAVAGSVDLGVENDCASIPDGPLDRNSAFCEEENQLCCTVPTGGTHQLPYNPQ